LSLPLFPAMSTDDVARVACALKRAVKVDLLVDRCGSSLRTRASMRHAQHLLDRILPTTLPVFVSIER